tara:strand:+ start:318 stop:1163 length:846 start_codon:yes stop_codon:yes gene_type:complete
MQNISKFLLIVFVLFVSCSNEEKKVSVIENTEIEKQMISAYNRGVKALEQRDALAAVKEFNEAEILYPISKWAPRAALMSAYAFYSQNYYGDAVFELERFIKTYPKDKNISYAHYLIAMCYYENIIDAKKDLAPLLKANAKFKFIRQEYPNTDFSIDAKYKMDLIKDIMASKEMYIAKHYIKKEKWIAAINRFKIVIKDYDTTVYVEEALHRLVEIHYKIGLIEESKKYANVLGYNYLSGKWYKESYRVFNRKYKDPIYIIKKNKKSGLTKKITSLFFKDE